VRWFPLAVLLAGCPERANFGALVIDVDGAQHEGRVGELLEINMRALGEPPILWSRMGSIPGLVLDNESGQEAVLRGRPGSTGRFSILINAQDNRNDVGIVSVELLVKDALVPPGPPQIGTESIPIAIIGTAYRAKIELITGSEPLTWNAIGLPEGLTFDRELHAIEGFPLIEGRSEILVSVQDESNRRDEATYQLDAIPMLVVLTGVLANAMAGTPYRYPLQAAGGRPPYRWRVASNWLPDGLEVIDEEIVGTPTAPGDYELSLEVTDTSSQSAVLGTTIRVR